MFNDEDFGRKQAGPKDLEPMSLDELHDYIEEMRGEIVRAEAEISRKKAHMESASSVFK